VGSFGLDRDVVKAFAGKGSGVMRIDCLIERMERDEFDLIAVGRFLLTAGPSTWGMRSGRSIHDV
jgi:hypothetical protein